jgi:hypothetical protein
MTIAKGTLDIDYHKQLSECMETKIRLLPLREAQTIAFKEEMQEAFQHGFESYYKEDNLSFASSTFWGVKGKLKRSYRFAWKFKGRMWNPIGTVSSF